MTGLSNIDRFLERRASARPTAEEGREVGIRRQRDSGFGLRCFRLLPFLVVAFGAWARGACAQGVPPNPTVPPAAAAQVPPAAQAQPASPNAAAQTPAAQPTNSQAAPPSQTPPAPAAAPPPAQPTTPEIVTSAQLDDLLTRIEASTELDDATKEQARALVAKAREDLKAAQQLETQQQSYAQQLQALDQRRAKIEKEARDQRRAVTTPWAYSPVNELEQTLAEKQADLAKAQAELTAVNAQLEQRTERRSQLREILATSTQKLADVNQRLQQLGMSTEPPLLIESKRLAYRAEKQRLEKEPLAAQSELAFYDAQDASGILRLQQTLASEQIAILKEEVEAWTNQLNQTRQRLAQDRLETAKEKVENAPDFLLPIYEDVVTAAEAELAVRRKRQQYQQELAAVKRQRAQLESAESQARQREAKVGSSPAFGIRLRQERRDLVDVAALRRERKQRLEEFENAQLDYFHWRDQLENLEPVEETIRRLDSQLDAAGLDENEVDALKRQIQSAVEMRKEYLSATVQAYDDYIDTLDTLDYEQQVLIDVTQAFAAYIDERVLWIPSQSRLTFEHLSSDLAGFRQVAGRDIWSPVVGFYAADLWSNPLWYFAGGAVWVGLIAILGRLKSLLARMGQKASNRLNTSMIPTVRSAFVTGVWSVIVPWPLWVLGWRAYLSPAAPDSMHDFGRSLLLIGVTAYFLELTRQTCRPGGLGQAHFGWRQQLCRMVLRQSRNLLIVGLPLAIVVALLRLHEHREGAEALQRMIFIALACLVASAFDRLTRRSSEVMQEWIEAYPGGWLDRLWILWHLSAVAVPLSLGILAYVGYYFTAQKLAAKLGLSYILVGTLLFLRAMLLRGLSFRQRRLAIEQARQRRAAAAAEATRYPEESASKSEVAAAAVAAQAGPEQEAADLSQVSTQTRRLANTTVTVLGIIGLWLVWIDVLPALNYFNDWMLPGTQVSYTELGIAILTIVVATTAARNIPGLLEITVLQKLPLDRSTKYAVVTVCRYVIVLVGLLLVGSSLGIGWDNVQWLVAALTVGLGFGLQEIFANFVSGLIILFERPIRVGDIVTIDGISGVVSRVRSRATTITDWDRKEYIVPNKEFITGKLLNWTLTDTINRIVIKIGVSYNADPERVLAILQEVVDAHPKLLRDPAPLMFFEGFGDSALNFTIFAFLPDLSFRLATTTELHTAIYRALKEAGIEIPYPQRDIHIRTGCPPELPPASRFVAGAPSEIE